MRHLTGETGTQRREPLRRRAARRGRAAGVAGCEASGARRRRPERRPASGFSAGWPACSGCTRWAPRSRSAWHRRLVYANLKLDWFHEFQEYWVEELGNRPIHPHDFYYLNGVYRQRLQTIHFEHLENPALASDDKHLESWRDSRTIYYLFAHTLRLALSPLRIQPFIRFVPRGGRVAEYGCGAAPVIEALARRYCHLDLQLVGADIPHLLFHYARWRFRRDRYVNHDPDRAQRRHPAPGPLRHDLLSRGVRAPAETDRGPAAPPPCAEAGGSSGLRLRAIGGNRARQRRRPPGSAPGARSSSWTTSTSSKDG